MARIEDSGGGLGTRQGLCCDLTFAGNSSWMLWLLAFLWGRLLGSTTGMDGCRAFCPQLLFSKVLPPMVTSSWPRGAGTEGLCAACAALVLWFSLRLGSLVCRLAVHRFTCAQGSGREVLHGLLLGEQCAAWLLFGAG